MCCVSLNSLLITLCTNIYTHVCMCICLCVYKIQICIALCMSALDMPFSITEDDLMKEQSWRPNLCLAMSLFYSKHDNTATIKVVEFHVMVLTNSTQTYKGELCMCTQLLHWDLLALSTNKGCTIKAAKTGEWLLLLRLFFCVPCWWGKQKNWGSYSKK